MSIPSYSVRHPVTTLMVFLAIVMIGVFCLVQFPIDQLPSADIPALTVVTTYEGAAPEDVEDKVTRILEDALSAIPDLKHITSSSSEGLSRIMLAFEWQTDLDTRANDARDAIDKVRAWLPDDVSPPRVLKLNLAEFPILFFGVRANESYPRLQKILEDYVVDPLKRIPGVAMAAAYVPLWRQVNVYVDREQLAAHHLTVADLARAIGAENQDVPAGNIKTDDTDYLVRIPGEFRDVESLKEIVVSAQGGRIVRLGDVARVEDDFKEPQLFITVDGFRGAGLVVRKQSGANTVEVARRVKRALPELTRRLPPDVRIFPVMDASEDIERMIRNLVQTLLQGAALAVLVVLLFLRRWRATLIIALAIPYSLLLALVAIFFLGYTINIMTLFGLIIAVGMVIDNAIVILENITRHCEAGERAHEAAVYGTTEVGLAVAASTLTTVCVFFPILFMRGITKVFFTEFAVVAAIALLGSLLSSVTLTPMLASVLLRRVCFRTAPTGRWFRASERAFRALEEFYARALDWALSHRKIVVFGALAIFGFSLLLVPRVGTEFMPKEDRSTVRGTVHLPVGTRVETTRKVMERIDRILREELRPGEFITTFTRCGSAGGMGMVVQEEDSHIGLFSVRLVPPEQRARTDREIAAILRRRLEELQREIPLDKFTVETTDMMSAMILGGERPLTINILGDDIEATDRLAAAIKQIVSEIPGTVDITTTRQKARPELQVVVDRTKASQMGLNLSAIGQSVRAAFFGTTASRYRHHGDEYDIVVRLRAEDRGAPEDLAGLPLRLPNGSMIRLDNVAEVRRAFGPVSIDRKDQSRVVSVLGDVYGRAIGDVVAEARERIAKLDIPPGVEIRFAGEAEEQREAFFWLTVALVIGTILVYMVMASQFESLLDPFVVMFSVPFALTGVLWSVWLRGFHISIIVFIGLLLLVGTVVNNAIVLVDYIGILRARGQPLREAVRNAGRTRLRPVLMTSLTTIVAVLPMAFRRGQGAEVWNPLGTVVAGGLLFSTLVTLILVPTLYTVFETHVKRRQATLA